MGDLADWALDQALMPSDGFYYGDEYMIEGIVEVVSEKRTSNGGTVYNAKVDGSWYGCGFNKPIFTEGNKIRFGVTQNGKYTNLDQDTVEVLEEAAAPALVRDEKGINAVDRRTVLHASRGSAIELVGVLVANDLLEIPKTKKNALPAVLAKVQELTVQFYQEGVTVMEGDWPFDVAASNGSTAEE